MIDSPQSGDPEAVFELWRDLAKYPASEIEAALHHLMEWILEKIGADQITWIAAVRVQWGEEARNDPFLGWRLRVRHPLRSDPEAYQRVLADYYNTEHYGKLTPTYYERSHDEKREAHVGMTGYASLAGAGRFRAHSLRDGWIDYAAFEKTLHYRLYFEIPGIIDRITIGYPITDGAESFFMIDRYRKADGSGCPFSPEEVRLAGSVARGVPELHRRLFLSHGLLMGDKPFSPMERKIMHHLLTERSEKEIAVAVGRSHATIHKYVTAIFTRFGVKSRAGLMARWLGET